MIKGYLNILLLKEINKSDHTGYSLIKIFKDKYGGVSPGSLYPMLSNLEKNKYIKCSEDGRKKVYSITISGRKTLAKLLKEKKAFIENINGKKDKFKGILDTEEFNKMKKFMEIMHSHEDDFGPVCMGIAQVKDSIVDSVEKNKSKMSNKELCKKIKLVLDKAKLDIKKIK